MSENNNQKLPEAVSFKSSQETSSEGENEGTIKKLIRCILIPYLFNSGNVKLFHIETYFLKIN